MILKSCRYFFVLAWLFLSLCSGRNTWAQSSGERWNVFIDLVYDADASLNALPRDSLHAVVGRTLKEQKDQGYYLASIDSIRVGERANPNGISIYVNRGPLVRVSSVSFIGNNNLGEIELGMLLDTGVGDILNPVVLNADIERIITAYGERGFQFAKVKIEELQVEHLPEDKNGLAIKLSIEEGNRVKVNDLMVIGAKRTKQRYIEYLLQLQEDEWLAKDLGELQVALDASQLFSRVSPIELIQVDEEEHIIVVNVDEEQPGSFDLVLGYQPPSAQGNSGGLVGNGHLDLRNPFGVGRRIGLKLNRLPGQISAVDATYSDSYFFGTPFSIEGGFVGLQQDSTYSQQSLRAAIGYSFLDGLETFATVNRQTTRPGQSGLELVQDAQRIPRSEITFWGFAIRYNSVDRPSNPQRGLHIETSLEGGRKLQTRFERSFDGDTTSVTTRVRQQRLDALLRVYVPVFSRQVMVLGNDAKLLVSEDVDVSDLFRFGGAQSLRGYEEDRFRGKIVSRFLLEWRYLLERTSFAYLFFDVGYIDRPATADFGATRALYPGYGLGMQFETGIGLMNVSLALSTTDAPSQAKVHVGLSLGL